MSGEGVAVGVSGPQGSPGFELPPSPPCIIRKVRRDGADREDVALL